jgi:hypothetical protein
MESRRAASQHFETKAERQLFRDKLCTGSTPCDDVCVTPETRASFAQHVQEIVLALPSEQSHGIRQRMGSVWDEIANAPKVAWLTAKTYDTLSESVRAQLGDAGTVELYRKVGRKLLANPHFQSFVETALKIFGVSPHAVLKIVPRGRDSVVKHSGTLVYEKVDSRCARLRLCDFPPSTFSKGTTALLLSGAFLGVLDAANAGEGAKVETSDVDIQRGCATFTLTW